MKRKTILISLILIFLLNFPVWADDYPTYAGRKLGRGIANAAFGWTEVLKSQEKVGDNHGIVTGLLWGTLDGLGNAVKRTGAGVLETATFPIKTAKDNNPVLEPEFPVANDQAGYRPKDYTF